MMLVDLDTGTVISHNMEWARSQAELTRGLLGRSEYPEGNALLLERCSSIHMFFMKFAIDVLFVDPELRVLKVVEVLKPWRMAACLKAHSTIELPAGTVRRCGIQVGHRFEVRK